MFFLRLLVGIKIWNSVPTENDCSALATITVVVRNEVISVAASWNPEHVALFSRINKVNKLETAEMFSRPDLK